MLELLHRYSETFGAFNLFRYVSFRALGAATTGLLFCLFFGPWIIRKLTELKLGQPIHAKEEVHRLAELHGGKSGTPTMGGVMILAAVVIATVLWAPILNRFVLLTLFAMLILGGLGFWDDLLKVKRKKSAGVRVE
ncbi:MAG: hypothetical protein R3F23_03550 [Verrucomicrobiia bacterium]